MQSKSAIIPAREQTSLKRKLTVCQLVKNIFAFSGIPSLIVKVTRGKHKTLA